MRTVRPPALLGRLVDLDVLDNEVGGIESLGVGIGLGVLEQVKQEGCRLLGPAGLADAKLLAYEHLLLAFFSDNNCHQWNLPGRHPATKIS